jgi:chromate transporter
MMGGGARPAPEGPAVPLRGLALLFLRLGTTAFGGPAAHLAMIEDEVVTRRKWMTRDHFLDLWGVTNLLPGPNSTEMAIQVGYAMAGVRGLLLAGACFILPAVSITLALAYAYTEFGTMPAMGPIVSGIRPAVVAVIATAVVRLAGPHRQKPFMMLAAAGSAAFFLAGVDAIVLLLLAGALGIVWTYRRRLLRNMTALFSFCGIMAIPVFAQLGGGARAAPAGADLGGLGLFFLKIGSVLYGSGYVLIAFLRDGLVNGRHWLSGTQLLDAIAVGQFTPGPVLSSATFVGYIILGLPGAAVATAGIFLPSFIFVLIVGPLVRRIRRSPLAGGFLDGVNAASLGLMAAVCVMLAGATFAGVPSWVIFTLSAAAVLVWKVNPAWIVLGAALAGWALSLVQ